MGGRESASDVGDVTGIAIEWFLNPSWRTLEEPSTASRRRASRGRDRGPEKALVKGGNLRSCSVVVLFSETALEEPFTAAERG